MRFLFTANTPKHKKSDELFCPSPAFHYFCTVRREKSADCKESILHDVWFLNSPKFQQRHEAINAHSVLYICMKRLNKLYSHCILQDGVGILFLQRYSVKVFGDT